MLMPLEGAARWHRRGAWVVGGATCVALVGAYLVGGREFDTPHPPEAYTFAVGMILLSAFVISIYTRRMQEALQVQQAAAAAELRLNDLHTRFSALLSHEIRTPLTLLEGFSTTLSDRWGALSEQERRSYVDILNQQLVRFERLVEDLLQIGKVESRPMHQSTEPASLRSIIRMATKGRDRITIAGDDVSVHCDAMRIEQLVARLVRQAGDSGVTIRLERQGNQALISVAAECPDACDGSEPGLNIGIARAIAEAHGGSVQDGEEGQLYVVELPIGGEVG
jgi:signal transduction histidine kinase